MQLHHFTFVYVLWAIYLIIRGIVLSNRVDEVTDPPVFFLLSAVTMSFVLQTWQWFSLLYVTLIRSVFAMITLLHGMWVYTIHYETGVLLHWFATISAEMFFVSFMFVLEEPHSQLFSRTPPYVVSSVVIPVVHPVELPPLGKEAD